MYSLKEEKISQITPFSVLADNKRIRNKIIDGKSTQATRSGKNKLDVIALNKTVNGLTFTNNGDGSVTINGTATATTYYNLNINGPDNSTNYFTLEL